MEKNGCFLRYQIGGTALKFLKKIKMQKFYFPMWQNLLRKEI